MVEKERREEKWHVGKEIPLALIFILILQTGGWVWWAATQSAKLDYLASMMSEFKSAQYTREDARRDLDMVFERHKTNVRRLDALEARAK